MAINIEGGLWVKGNLAHGSAIPSFINAGLIDAATEKTALVFTVPKTGTLDWFEFRIGALVNTPDNGLRLSFQDVDASGVPDGTLDQFRDITTGFAAGTWMTPGLMTDDGTDTGVKRSVTFGQKLACVIQFVSFVAGDSVDFSELNMDIGIDYLTNARAHFTSAWLLNPDKMMVLLKYNDGTYQLASPDLFPVSALNSGAFSTTTTPDERAHRFKVANDCELTGVSVRCDLDANADLVLYDAANSVLWSASSIAVQRSIATGGNIFQPIPNIPITANAVYRLGLKPTTTGNITYYSWSAASNSRLAPVPGGIECYMSTRVDGGAWTDVTTERFWIDLRFNEFTDTGGTGGEHSHLSIG